jgi:putative transposase
VRRLCALYGVTRAGYYAWRHRGMSARVEQDRILVAQILSIFEASRRTYGSPRVHRALAAQGVRVSRRRVERLMRAADLRARIARLYRANPKLHDFFRLPNRQRAVAATRPNQVWVGDITYVPVKDKWCYLAVVMDRCSRRLLGWSVGRHRDVRLTRAALMHAVHQRPLLSGAIFHSDRGSEYAGHTFRSCLRSLGLVQSMNDRALGDNAHMESFFHSLKADVVHGVRFKNDAELREQLRSYLWFYNHQRLHSALGYRSPVDYERGAA